MTTTDVNMQVRLPVGSECQCCAEGCGVFFSGESAFDKHWTKGGHVHPSAVGLVERQRRRGPVWGWPDTGRNPRSTRASQREGPQTGSVDVESLRGSAGVPDEVGYVKLAAGQGKP